MIKAILFDIDDTLLYAKNHICPESTKKALRQLRKKGLKIFIATGRNPIDLQQERLLEHTQFQFDAYITCNGQYCYSGDEVIYESAFSEEDIQAMLKLYKANPWPILVIKPDARWDVGDPDDERFHRANQDYGVPWPKFTDIDTALAGKVLQILCFQREGDLPDPLQTMKKAKKLRWHECGYDLVPADGGKAASMKYLLEYFAIKPEECMAFGDGENDVDMLRTVGVGVAMGNGSQQAKDAADYVTAEIWNDGVAKALKRFNIIE